MTRFSVCPDCGSITEWPDNTLSARRRCLKCGAIKKQPMAPDRKTAELVAKNIGGTHEHQN